MKKILSAMYWMVIHVTSLRNHYEAVNWGLKKYKYLQYIPETTLKQNHLRKAQ
jgi:hypothetical protein